MNNTSVLIASFDKNRDIWPLFAYFFQKYWPECPYQVYLGANGENYSESVPEKWNYINKGPDVSWSRSMLEYVEDIPTDTVLLMLDDYLLTGLPSESEIDKAVQYASLDAVYVRLNPEPRPRIRWKKTPDFGVLRYFDRYRASLKAAVWNKHFLKKMLLLELDPWTFELTVGEKTEHRDLLFLSAFEYLLPNRHCVESGKFTYWLTDFLKEEGYSEKLSSERSVLSPAEYTEMFGKLGKLKGALVDLLPARFYYYYKKLNCVNRGK